MNVKEEIELANKLELLKKEGLSSYRSESCSSRAPELPSPPLITMVRLEEDNPEEEEVVG